jgi:hypothetical protein
VRYLLRNKLRATCDPDILRAALREDPRDPRALMSRCELRRKGRAKYLLDGERLRFCRLNRSCDASSRGCHGKQV